MPGLAEQVRELLPHAVEVTLDYPRAAPGTNGNGHGQRALPPAELFASFYARKNGSAPGAELAKLFTDLYEEAHG